MSLSRCYDGLCGTPGAPSQSTCSSPDVTAQWFGDAHSQGWGPAPLPLPYTSPETGGGMRARLDGGAGWAPMEAAALASPQANYLSPGGHGAYAGMRADDGKLDPDAGAGYGSWWDKAKGMLTWRNALIAGGGALVGAAAARGGYGGRAAMYPYGY